MTGVPDDPSYGALVLRDRPLGAPAAWGLMLVPPAVVGAALLAVNVSAWPLSLGLLVGLGLVSVLIFGDRLLIEHRLHERALISRTRLPGRPVWVVPLFMVEPEAVRVSGRVSWESPDERVLPASSVLRSLPWGRVVRVPGPEPFAAKVKGGETLASVPRHSVGAFGLESLGGAQLWAFSFRSPDTVAHRIGELARLERLRLDLDRRP